MDRNNQTKRTAKRKPSSYVKKKRLGKTIVFRPTQEEEMAMDDILEELRKEDPKLNASDVYRAAISFYIDALKDEKANK